VALVHGPTHQRPWVFFFSFSICTIHTSIGLIMSNNTIMKHTDILTLY
jgi:hypothetical protein